MRVDSARGMAAATSIGSGRKSGRSIGSIVDVHNGSFVPLTMRRFSAISAVRRALGRHERLTLRGTCACACTTSMGAIVPISTFVWLLRSSSSAREHLRRRSTDCTAKT